MQFRHACGHVDEGTCPHQVLKATGAPGSCHFHIAVQGYGRGLALWVGVGLGSSLIQLQAHDVGPLLYNIGDQPNSLVCTDLNQCGAHRDTELCRLCYKQTNNFYLKFYDGLDLLEENVVENKIHPCLLTQNYVTQRKISLPRRG